MYNYTMIYSYYKHNVCLFIYLFMNVYPDSNSSILMNCYQNEGPVFHAKHLQEAFGICIVYQFSPPKALRGIESGTFHYEFNALTTPPRIRCL